MPAHRLSAVATIILALPQFSIASSFPRELKNMKDTPIHTNTQACIPEEKSNGAQVIVAFVIGLFVMFVVAYFYNQCKPSGEESSQREKPVVTTAIEMDETMDSGRESTIEMASQKKRVHFADEEAPATREVSQWFSLNLHKCRVKGKGQPR